MENAEQSSFCKLSLQLPLDSFLLDIHFSSNKKRIGILGASGSGKSMCLKSIAGIVTPRFCWGILAFFLLRKKSICHLKREESVIFSSPMPFFPI